MKRSIWTIHLAVCLALALTIPALAAGPSVTKSVIGESVDGTAVVVIKVTATDGAIYGIDIKDASGSINDIIAPKGWVGITSGKKVIFRTGGKPIRSGASTSFRLVTTNKHAPLSVSFRNERSSVGDPKSL